MKHLALVAALAFPLAYSQAQQVDAQISAGNDPNYANQGQQQADQGPPYQGQAEQAPPYQGQPNQGPPQAQQNRGYSDRDYDDRNYDDRGYGQNYGYVAGPPVCAYGYYSYYPYACAPYGFYGPRWFAGGVFIGAGPWYGWGWGHG
ncbi:MAG: hypothetical protein ABSG72_09495, partial [Candidatus Sulfotelmatobacter sp.]